MTTDIPCVPTFTFSVVPSRSPLAGIALPERETRIDDDFI